MVGTARRLQDVDLPHSPPSAPLVVVTGAAGFIGSALCEALLAGGWRVRGIDAFTSNYDPAQKRANLAGLLADPDFELVEADLMVAELGRLLDSADAVAHLAGEPGVSCSWGGEFGRYVERNILATQRLLDEAVARQIRRFVYASSSSIYGDGIKGPAPESAIPRPASPYGVTKLAAELLVGAYAARGLSAISMRYFSVYGPRQRPDMALHRFIEAALDLRPMTVYGDGTQVRDFTYVDDIVAATIAALTAELQSGTALNVASGHPVPVSDVISIVKQLLDLDVLVVNHEPERHGDVARTNGATAAARSVLGWEPYTDLTLGIAKQVEWHLARRRRAGGRKTIKLASVTPLTQRRGSRLFVYTQDGLGLGHLRRTSSLATEFLSQSKGGSVLTISDSPLGTLLHDLPNHDYLKLPSIVKAGPGDWHPLALPLDFQEVHHLRSRVILEAATAFHPDVLLVDHMPHGAMGELIPTLEALQAGPTRVVLGVRDIIDSPDVVHQRWQEEGAFDALERFYDHVLVYGSRDILDFAAEYQWPAELAKLVRYCGYVCTPERPDHPSRIRARTLAGLPDGRLIIAMAGGGSDGYPMMSTLLDAVPEIRRTRPCAVIVVTGPFMPDAERLDLKHRAETLQVRVRTAVRDPLSYMAAADLVVAMAGYNTSVELLRVRTPALLIPRRGPSSEQRIRARRFAERGWVAQIDPDDLVPETLAAAVLGALSRHQHPGRLTSPDLDGLRQAVGHLHALALAARAPRVIPPRTGATIQVGG